MSDPIDPTVPTDLPSVAAPAGGASPKQRRARSRVGRRDRRLDLVLSEPEYAVIAQAATTAGLAVTAWVGDTALAVAKGRLAPMPTVHADRVRALVQARVEVTRIGVNLNQLAAAMNAARLSGDSLEEAVPAPQMEAVLHRVEAALRRIDRATAELANR
jgi:uncharacterized protein (DUF1778 family)